MSTKLFGFVNVPTPGMVIITPVPEVSLMDHARRTMLLPPRSTAFGVAVKDMICGAGQPVTVTVAN